MARQDFTEDGSSDILFRSGLTNDVAYWDMFGGNVASVNDIGNVDQSWLIVDTGNYVNGSLGGGYDDILWRSLSTGEVVYWDMFKGKPVSQVGLGTVDFGWLIQSYEGSSNFSGDGEDDILWRQVNTGEVVVWNMNNGSIANKYSLGTVGLEWTISGTNDFTGDGSDDILWRNNLNGEVGFWDMQGSINQGYVRLDLVPGEWQVVGTADFTGDGTADLLWRNYINGDVGIWDMDGGSISSRIDLRLVGLDWETVQANDYTGDGSEDILWQNSFTSELVVWDFQGGSVAAEFGLPRSPSDWFIA